MRRALVAGAALLASAIAAPARADDLSGADKLRVIWSQQMTWTPAGIPIVTVGIVEGRDEIALEGGEGPPRLLPEGEGGAEVRGGRSWRLRAVATHPAKLRFSVVVASARPDEAERLSGEATRWRERGFEPRTVEMGLVFGLRGQVIDMRRLALTVAPKDAPYATMEQARADARVLAGRFSVETGVHAQVVERPRGYVEARDERGTVVKNEGVIWFAPGTDEGTLAVADVPKGDSGATERRTYAGHVYVTVGADGRLTAVNAIPEDRLLAGLLPAEIGAGAPPEALKAQAVAARNELLAKLGTRHLTDPYSVCSRAHCQVYAGVGRDDPRAAAAVTATRGELLVRPDGRLVDAVYSAVCGGHTEDNDRAWAAPPDPALRGVLDAEPAAATTLAPTFQAVTDADRFLGPLPARPACAASPHFRWTTRVEAGPVADRAGLGRIREVKLLDRGVSGRVVRLSVEGERGAKEVRGELEIRRFFGGLKSSLFVLNVERDPAGFATAFRFAGGGFGHGIGMCQAGAIDMADHKHGYREILDRYYRDAKVQRFY